MRTLAGADHSERDFPVWPCTLALMSSDDSSSASTSTAPTATDIQGASGPANDVPPSDPPQVIPTPPSSLSATTSTTPGPTGDDRSTLLSKARSFLSSPQIVHQDAQAKRTFLKEKGLDDVEVESLLREVPAVSHFQLGLDGAFWLRGC